jgi:hypothetical protein
LSDPEGATRRLLAACGLRFDAACLRFHEAEREVRTASAAQVRSPLRITPSVESRYGGRIEPLRAALAAREVFARDRRAGAATT